MIRTILTLGVCAGLFMAEPAFSADDFDQFCRDHFGVAHEELTTHLPGDELKLLPDGQWSHVSEQSATLAFESNLPMVSHIEYGLTPALGSKTEPTERAFYLHIHRLTGLETGKTYHYKLVGTDERGRAIESAVATINPKKVANAIYLPNPEQPEPPFNLDRADATYILTKDVIADATAINILAPNITLDLNGYTIIYNNVSGASNNDDQTQRTFGFLATQGAQGVRSAYATRGSGRLVNGTIKQGNGGGGYGSVPVMFRGAELAGLTIEYHGPQVSGIENETKHAHHNIILDRGSDLTNRHQGVQAIGGATQVNHNLVKRARHRAINGVSNAKIYRNELYVDSCTTNSFGIMLYKTTKCEVSENRIFGRGYLMIGIGTVSEGVGESTIAKNFIHVQSHRPDDRWAEYGAQSGAYGVRVTWGGKDIEYVDNVIVSKGRDGGMVRGIWFCPTPNIENVVFRRNLIKVLAETEDVTKWGAIVISGDNSAESKRGLFVENTVWSNFCHVRLGEEYGAGVNARFVGNTFIRVGDDPRYATVICGFHNFNNEGSVFIDTKLEGGASFDLVKWEGTGRNGFKVGRREGGNDVIEREFRPGGAQ